MFLQQCPRRIQRAFISLLLEARAQLQVQLGFLASHALYGGFRLVLESGLASIDVIETTSHLAHELDMRNLVFTDRNEFRAIDEHIGGLQQRIAEKTVGRQVLVLELFDLVLVSRHALQPSQRRAHRQQREQFGMLWQPALDEDRGFFGVQASGDPVDHHVVDRLLDHLAVFIVRGQCVPVGDEEEAVMVVLQLDPVLERAMVVAEVECAGRAHA